MSQSLMESWEIPASITAEFDGQKDVTLDDIAALESQLAEHVSEIDAEAKKLRRENISLQQANLQVRQVELTSLEKDMVLENLRQAESRLKNEIRQLQERVRSQEEQIKKQTFDLKKQSTHSVEHASNLCKLQDELRTKTEELKHLAGQHRRLTEDFQDSELDWLSKENTLAKEIARLKERAQGKESEIEKSRLAFAESAQVIEESQQALGELRQTVESQSQTIETLKRDKLSVDLLLEEQEAMLLDVQSSVMQRTDELVCVIKNQEIENATLKEQSRTLERSLAEARAQLATRLSENDEIHSSAQQQIAELFETAQKQQFRADAFIDQLAKSKTEIQKLNAQNQNLIAEIERRDHALDQSAAGQSELREILRKRNTEIKYRINSQKEIEEFHARQEKERAQQLAERELEFQEQANSWNRQEISLIGKIQALETQIDDVDAMAQMLNARNTELTTENTRLRDLFTAAQWDWKTTEETLHKTISERESEIAHRDQELSQTAESRTELEKEVRHLMTLQEEFEEGLTYLQTENARIKAEGQQHAEDLSEEKESYRTQFLELQETSHRELADLQETSRRQIADLQVDIIGLRDEKSDVETRLTARQLELQLATETSTALTDRVETLTAQKEQLVEGLKAKGMEIHNLNVRLATKASDDKATIARLTEWNKQQERREGQLRTYSLAINQEKEDLARQYSRLAAETRSARTLHPLRDYLSLTEYEISNLEIELKSTPTISPTRQKLEESLAKMVQQRDFLRSTLNSSLKLLEQQAEALERQARNSKLQAVPPLPPRT